MQNLDKVLDKFRVLLHVVIAQCCQKFYFKISRSPARHLAATDVATYDTVFNCGRKRVMHCLLFVRTRVHTWLIRVFMR